MSVTHDDIHYPDWKPDFAGGPIWLRPFEKVTTLVSVRDATHGRGEDTLFYIPNGEIYRSEDRGSTYGNGVRGFHSFARDPENDRVHLVDVQIEYFDLLSAWGDVMRFRGLLTEMQAWDPIFESPFDNAVKKNEDPEKGGDYYANAGYPYSAPKVVMPAKRVQIDFQYGKHLDKWYRKNFVDHQAVPNV